MTPRPTHYIDFAAYRRLGRSKTPPRRHSAAPTDYVALIGWCLALALALSFWAYVYILVTR